ncbi:MAG: peptidase M22 [Clostridia bacterium]|nr:peptidase M22 [Clostridia bacterium]
MDNRVIVGIDTSNYTTSCAICSLEGEIIENYKILLPVKIGENGLRQSDAVFAHVKNFQNIANIIKEKHANYDIVAIGYSAYPRDVEGSYMPCFLVGQSICEMLSSLYNIPIFKFSHQLGHIRAALYSSKFVCKDFIAFHISGGTTEIVNVHNHDGEYKIDIIGGANDLHAGQAIDRIGVKMGLLFPCGKEIEKLALDNKEIIPKPKTSVSEYFCNLSGLENLATKIYQDTGDKCLTAAYVLDFIGSTLEKLVINLRKNMNFPIIFAGGVMSNQIIKNRLFKFDNVYFAEPQFSSDNAAGISLLAWEKYLRGKK